ncbi:MAG TPA: M24 family metallopeptidase [Terriglobales bacterium]|nr:M24 family metallopeptidase [Terriglobales bacterium]
MNLESIQQELQAAGLAGWLFFDHHHRDPMAYRILGLPSDGMVTRRWFYLIPASGAPRKLVHRIEAGGLDPLPGERAVYSQWGELRGELAKMLAGLGAHPKIAMQYSPGGAIPAVSMVDAGTIEMLRELGAEVVSSGDLISRFDATWSDAMLASHRAAGRAIDAAITGAFAHVRESLDNGGELTEYALQQWLVQRLQADGLDMDEAPIVATNAHAGDPHYLPASSGSSVIAPGDVLLLDVWGKLAQPGSAFYDVTWMGYVLRPGETEVPAEFAQTFAIARDARDAAIELALARIAAGAELRGFEVDRAARAVIATAGLGEFFVHRTGHSLGLDVHSTGANMDDFETHDERRVLPRTAFTIEPGIYCPGGRAFGVRTEVNVYVGARGAEVTGPRQREFVRI